MSDKFESFEVNDDGKKQTIIVNHVQPRSNGAGIAGFVLALIALFLGWVPILGWLLWLIGLILSFVGVFKKPNGLAIAGVIISFLGLIILVFVFAGLAILGSSV